MSNRKFLFSQNYRWPLVSFAFILIILLLGIYAITAKKGPTIKQKAATIQLRQEISTNIAKYQPKYTFLKIHPGNLNLTAESAVVVNENDNQILYAKNEHIEHWPASITKILTMVIALENYKPNQLCTVSKEAAETQPDKISMQVGEKMRVDDLIYGMMMISANDAAEVLAECDSGGQNAFIDKMNEKAKSLGLKNSHFSNPNGLDNPNHYSSAFDMATITRYALETLPETLQYMGRKSNYSVSATDHNEAHSWYQISHLLFTYPGMEAAKTGYTDEAKNTYVGIAKRNGKRIIIVYFGAQTSTSDATTLLDYGFSVDPTL